MTPFLLVPGLNCDARVYAPVAPALWQFGPVTIACHLEGAGMTDIAAAILRDAPPAFALGGFSMGGYLAFEILRQAPERVLKLALIDTRAEADPPDLVETRRRRTALAEGGKFSLVVEQSFPDAVHDDNVDDSRLYSLHRTMAEANGPQAYVRHQEAIIGRPDSRPMLGSIRVPTLVVVGEGDKITPPASARTMHQGIAGSVLEVIPRAGHLALLEQPELVNAALRIWAAA
ncbi:MAG: alpha/beta fold hydrolase [Devosia sp.]|jgi:pimeloyl-ACP methyl ester carboxylesterase